MTTVPTTSAYIFSSELARYAGVSFIALSVDIAVLVLLTSIVHIPYLLSALAAFLMGILITYVLSVRYVFKRRTLSHSRNKEFTLFLVIGIFGLLLNEMILWIGTGIFGMYYLISKVFSAVVVFAWNYTARKRLLF